MADSRVLADRWIAREGILWDVARIAAANLLMVLCARIEIPLPWTPVPITGQTFGVMLVAVLLGARRAAITMALYLLEGAAGLPVFAGFGAPGAARLIGPTAGYLWSYPIAAFVTGWLTEKSVYGDSASHGPARTVRLVAAILPGEALILTVGYAWLAAGMGLSLRAAFLQGAAPFLPGEVIKIALLVAAVRGLDLASQQR
jgi:biotin transport system substrate-specific component